MGSAWLTGDAVVVVVRVQHRPVMERPVRPEVEGLHGPGPEAAGDDGGADPDQGIPGDTLADVRAKGFTIYLDSDERVRRPNSTR